MKLRPLRILMFTTFYPPFSFGGDAVGVQRMARALVARGHEVAVVHDEDAYLNLGGKPPAETASNDGVRRIGLRSRSGILANLLTQQTGAPIYHLAQLRRIIDSADWDITWFNNMSLVGGPGLMKFGKGLRVYEAHEHWLVCPSHVLWRYDQKPCDGRRCLRCVLAHRRPPQVWRYTGLIDRRLDQIDLLVAKSEFSRQKHAEFGLRQDMEVIPYFLPDSEPVTAPAEPAERPYFLFVGRLEKIKGLQDVIPSFAGEGDADLVILGDGDYADALKKQAAGMPRVRFLGRMAPEELTEYYRGALGLIVPSVCFETFGIILIEAFRLGIPVIARRIGPFPEIVEQSGAGLLFEDRAGLEAAMTLFASDPEKRRQLATNARTAFEQRWREDRVLQAWGQAMARAARRSGRNELAALLEAGVFENGAAAG